MALDVHASCEVDGILYVIGGHKYPGCSRPTRLESQGNESDE